MEYLFLDNAEKLNNSSVGEETVYFIKNFLVFGCRLYIKTVYFCRKLINLLMKQVHQKVKFVS